MAEFDPNQMPRTNRHAIRYPGGTDLVKYASQQFKAMAESIDDNIDDLPDEITAKVTQASQDTKKWRDEAETFAAEGGALQDAALATLIRRQGSETRKALDGDVCLWLGDSFTQGYQASSPAKRYSRLVSDRMGWVESNYAVGGSGYVAGGESSRNYLQQAQLAKQNGVEPDVIIVAGSQNDYTTDIYTAVVACLSYIKTTWPQARLICITSLWSAKSIPDYVLARDSDVYSGALSSGARIIPHGYQWLYGETSLIASDGTHPNDAGYRRIADIVIQALAGAESSLTHYHLPVTADPKFTATNVTLDIVSGIVTLSGWFDKNGNAAYLDTVCVLDSRAAPSHDRYISLFTNGGNNPILGKLTPNGILQLATWPQGISSKQVIIPPTSWRVGQ